MIYRSPDRAEAERRLDRFLVAVGRADLPSFSAFANGLALWRPSRSAHFEQPTTNGYAEEVINKVKVVKHSAYGLPTFEGFRDRVLMPATEITRAHPRILPAGVRELPAALQFLDQAQGVDRIAPDARVRGSPARSPVSVAVALGAQAQVQDRTEHLRRG